MDAPRVLDALAAAGRSLAVAESFTGGRVLDGLTNVPGASRVLRGGIVAYADGTKSGLLGIPEATLKVHGAVSAATAKAMARGARRVFGADYGVATTGIAGPTGATPAKPVGLSYAGVAGALEVRSSRAVHAGDRRAVKDAAWQQAMRLLEQFLHDEGIL